MHVHPPATYAENSLWVTCVPLSTVMSGQWRDVGRVTKCWGIVTASRGLTEAHGQAGQCPGRGPARGEVNSPRLACRLQ